MIQLQTLRVECLWDQPKAVHVSCPCGVQSGADQETRGVRGSEERQFWPLDQRHVQAYARHMSTAAGALGLQTVRDTLRQPGQFEGPAKGQRPVNAAIWVDWAYKAVCVFLLIC